MTDRRWLVVVLLAGLLVRLPFLTVDFGKTADMRLFASWARGMEERGLARAYEDRRIDYPPLSLWLLRAAGALERWVPMNACLKAVPVLADVLIAALLALAPRRNRLSDRVAGDSAEAISAAPPGAAVSIAAAYLFNPAVWYVSAWWGQWDSAYALLALASVVALEAGRPALACLSLALACNVKMQSVALAPLVALETLRRGGVRAAARGAAVAAGALGILYLPWLATGRAADIGTVLTHLPSGRCISVSAHNLWYLLLGNRAATTSSETLLPGIPFSYQTLGLVLLSLLTAVVVSRGAADLALAGAVLPLGLYVLATHQHERYAFAALPFLTLAAARAPRLVPALIGLSATLFFNLVVVAPFTPALGINLFAAPPSPRTSLLRGIAWATAAFHVAILVWLTLQLWKRPWIGSVNAPSGEPRPER